MDARDIVVLTTEERSPYYIAVFGYDTDMRFGPKADLPLEDLLHNVLVAGGKLVVIDDMFFVDQNDLARGLERFVTSENRSDQLKIIIVSSRRKPGDKLLAFLVMYCGMYNVLYGVNGPELTQRLEELLTRENRRADVFELIECARWDSFSMACMCEDDQVLEQQRRVSMHEQWMNMPRGEGDLTLDIGDGRAIAMHIEVKPQITP